MLWKREIEEIQGVIILKVNDRLCMGVRDFMAEEERASKSFKKRKINKRSQDRNFFIGMTIK